MRNWISIALLMVLSVNTQAKVTIPTARKFYFPIGKSTNAKPYIVSQRFMEDREGMYLYFGHLGEDIACPIGTKIYAIADGKVAVVTSTKGWGKYVIIEHRLPSGSCLPKKIYTLYGHLSKIYCKKGQIVYAGRKKPIALSGIMGTGPHLHYEMKSKPLAGVGYTKKNNKNKEKVYYDGMAHWNPRIFISRLSKEFRVISVYPPNGAKDLPQKFTILIDFSDKVSASGIDKLIKIAPLPQKSDFLIRVSSKNPNRIEIGGMIFNPGVKYKFTILKGIKSKSGKITKSDYSVVFTTKVLGEKQEQTQELEQEPEQEPAQEQEQPQEPVLEDNQAQIETGDDDNSTIPYQQIDFFQIDSETGEKIPLGKNPTIPYDFKNVWIQIELRPISIGDRLSFRMMYPGKKGFTYKDSLHITTANISGRTYREWKKVISSNRNYKDRLGQWEIRIMKADEPSIPVYYTIK